MAQNEQRTRPHNEAKDAILLLWVLLLSVLGIVYYVAYSRLHIEANQLIELSVYPLLGVIFCWEVLRYRLTKTRKMDQTWPRPIPYIAPSTDRKHFEDGRRKDAALLGHDISGRPFY